MRTVKQITIKVVKRGKATDYRIKVEPGIEGEQPKLADAVHLLAVATQMVVEQSYKPNAVEK